MLFTYVEVAAGFSVLLLLFCGTTSNDLIIRSYIVYRTITFRADPIIYRTITFRAVIEESNNNNDVNKRIEVYTSNDPIVALSEFKSNFYDLLLVDINMPDMNGFELCEKILAIDINVRICFMSSGEINREALREIYPTRQEGCFIRKPVIIDYLLKRIRSELD
ncbi:MAG: response regulator [Candidatus Nitrosopolaris sp.]